MKKLLLVIAILLCFSFVYADETGGANWNSQGLEPWVSGSDINEVLTETGVVEHSHSYTQVEREDEAGAGIDVTVWQNENKTVAVEVQEKYDFNNEENKAYVVMKINLWEMFSK